MNYFYVFCGKKVGLGNFGHFVTIEDFRLNIGYLRSASGESILKKKERSLRLVGVVAPTPRRATSTNLQSSIFNLHFPDKTGFTLRCNPASGISLRAVGSTLRGVVSVAYGTESSRRPFSYEWLSISGLGITICCSYFY